jgi:membrane protein YdbS with pleckstrin-like domain
VAREALRLTQPGLPREIDRYLVPSEKVIFSTRLHLFMLTEPIATTLLGLFLLGWFDTKLEGDQGFLSSLLVIGWIAVFGRLLWKLFEWYRKIFLATNKRLILVYGIFFRKVAMMPLSKVTDMRYDKNPMGQVLGYGKFVLESAGQDQALTAVDYVPEPDLHYREINAVLFAPADVKSSVRIPPKAKVLPVQEPNSAWWSRRR